MTTTLSQAITQAKQVSQRTGATLYIRAEAGRYPISTRDTAETILTIQEGRITDVPYEPAYYLALLGQA
jgi:hypothetical protein